ncbi:MAG: sugar ABC transporter permease [Clostridiales Family XIII bacterium]|jgi:multiple sugar transport system permease protein|nr:sugar ABC transporter permease [Clostridiales Family XIII bacterium]
MLHVLAGGHVSGNSYRIDKNNRLASILLAPAVVVVGFVSLYPLAYSGYLSLFNYRLTRLDEMGFDPTANIGKLLADSLFAKSLGNTLVVTAFTVGIGLVLGMVFALVLDQLTERFEKLRGILIMPWVIPGIVVGYLFMYIFDGNVGVANYLLQTMGFIDAKIPWLMRGDTAMAAIIVANVWNQTPFYTLMFAAALKGIPVSVKEAAYVEGASRASEFFRVTLPQIKTVVVITSLLEIIRNFNNFPIIFTMTGGGPAHETLTSVLYIYKVAFDQYDMGYASFIGVIWVAILMGLAILYIRLLNPKEARS